MVSTKPGKLEVVLVAGDLEAILARQFTKEQKELIILIFVVADFYH
jgi:hypothetical protein